MRPCYKVAAAAARPQRFTPHVQARTRHDGFTSCFSIKLIRADATNAEHLPESLFSYRTWSAGHALGGHACGSCAAAGTCACSWLLIRAQLSATESRDVRNKSRDRQNEREGRQQFRNRIRGLGGRAERS
eukprot:364838-Chlamydomonas_euryale.AAC.9